MRHRIAHDDRRSALQAPHAPRSVAAHRQPSREGKGVVHPAVGHLRPLRRLAREQISARLAGTIADDLRIARRRSVQRYRRTSTSRQRRSYNEASRQAIGMVTKKNAPAAFTTGAWLRGHATTDTDTR